MNNSPPNNFSLDTALYKAVGRKHKSVQCDQCNLWVHIKCNRIDIHTYNLLKLSDLPWYCITCTRLILPFSNITNLDLNSTLACKNLPFHKSKKIGIPSQFNSLFDDLNNISNSGCKYADVSKFNRLNLKSKSHLHLNIASLSYHIDDLKILLGSFEELPDIIGITETKLQKNVISSTNIELDGYSTVHTPTEAKKGGALLYLKSNLSYKVRSDLSFYKPKELESIFIEIINPQSTNTIVGCIYRHPSMCTSEFNEDYLNPLMDKLSLKARNIVLMGDFNVDLMKHNNSKDVSDFLATLTSNSFFPFVTLPTRITAHSKTLIDNIFMNFHSPDIISGNLTVSISDHLPQFVIIPTTDKAQQNIPVVRRCFKNFNQDNFMNDISNCDWDNYINEKDNVNDSLAIFLKVFESILDKHAPFKELTNKQKLKLNKPWMTMGLITSINTKNKIHKKYLKSKNPNTRDNLHLRFKAYRNNISNLLKLSKKNYYT